MRYWLYKCNRDGGPAGYWGDWRSDVFASRKKEIPWGGDRSSRSPEVHRHLGVVARGDVVVAYQTDEKTVVGFCVVTLVAGGDPGDPGDRAIWLAPIHELSPGFAIHDHEHGTPLETSTAVRGPVMLRELEKAEMEALVRLSGTPQRVLDGEPPASRRPR
jgi:hypothetical protein